MRNEISDIAIRLSKYVEETPVDWNAFEAELLEIDDLNLFDKDNEETILSEFVMGWSYDKCGEDLPTTIQYFLSCGYDVHANYGKNGICVLESLCLSSYDRYVLDAAKILLNAGTQISYQLCNDNSSGVTCSVLESISWFLSGAWSVDKDFHYANILDAYYAMILANIKGKDYDSICCYSDCIGSMVTGISISKKDKEQILSFKGGLKRFSEPMIMWFDDKAMVIEPYTELIINPVYVDEHKEELIDVSFAFPELIGSSLEDVQYADATICYFTFSNGHKIFFASRNIEERKCIGTFEVRACESPKNIETLNIDGICGRSGYTYAETVKNYDESAIALFCGKDAYLLHPVCGKKEKYQMKLLHCTKNLLARYTRQYPVSKLEGIVCFYDDNELTAMRFKCGEQYLYFKTTQYNEIEVQLADYLYNPQECQSLHSERGQHMEFSKRSVND